MSDLLTKKETAKLIGCSTRQIDLLRKKGQFPEPTHPPGKHGQIRFRRKDIIEFINL